jgi:hypothetical protein
MIDPMAANSRPTGPTCLRSFRPSVDTVFLVVVDIVVSRLGRSAGAA